MLTHGGEGDERECVPEVIIFLFARLVLAWERGTNLVLMNQVLRDPTIMWPERRDRV